MPLFNVYCIFCLKISIGFNLNSPSCCADGDIAGILGSLLPRNVTNMVTHLQNSDNVFKENKSIINFAENLNAGSDN